MPSQPMAKKVLKMKKNAAAAMPGADPLIEVVPASMAMEADMPTAPKSINFLRPTFSTRKTAIQEARKYSVPLQAARMRERVGPMPISLS